MISLLTDLTAIVKRASQTNFSLTFAFIIDWKRVNDRVCAGRVRVLEASARSAALR